MVRLLLGLEIIEHLSHLADNALECVWVTCLNNYRDSWANCYAREREGLWTVNGFLWLLYSDLIRWRLLLGPFLPTLTIQRMLVVTFNLNSFLFLNVSCIPIKNHNELSRPACLSLPPCILITCLFTYLTLRMTCRTPIPSTDLVATLIMSPREQFVAHSLECVCFSVAMQGKAY